MYGKDNLSLIPAVTLMDATCSSTSLVGSLNTCRRLTDTFYHHEAKMFLVGVKLAAVCLSDYLITIREES